MQKFTLKPSRVFYQLPPPLVPPDNCLSHHLLSDQPNHILGVKAEMRGGHWGRESSSKAGNRWGGCGPEYCNGEITSRSKTERGWWGCGAKYCQGQTTIWVR